LARPTGIEPV